MHVVDAEHFLVAGTFRGTASFDVGPPTLQTLTSNGGSDVFLANVATPTGVDDASVELTPADLNGFLFDFYGTQYDSLFVSTNGLITFGAANDSSANTDLLDPPAEASIAAFWEDLVTGSAQAEAVFWEVLGSGDDQRLIVQWNDVQVDNPNAAAIGPLSFQAILHERDGSIILNYQSVADPQIIAAGPQTPVGTFTKGTQNQSDIASDQNGNYVIVWNSPDQDGDLGGIYGRLFNAAGVAQGSEFRISQTVAGDQTLPRVSMNASGRFVVAWHGNASTGNPGVYARIYNLDGTPRTPEFRANPLASSVVTDAEPSIDDSGNLIIAWHGQGTEDADGVYYRRFDASGQPLGTVNEVQRMRFLGPPAVGSTYSLILGGVETADFAFGNNPNTNANNIRNALRALSNTGNGIQVVALPTADEVQSLTFVGNPTAGTFRLGLQNVPTADIAFAGATMGATTAINIQTALEALPNVGAGNVVVAQVGTSDIDFTVTFTGALGGTNIDLLTLQANALDAGTVDIAEVVAGTTAGLDFEVRFNGNDGGTDYPQLLLGETQGGVTHIDVLTVQAGFDGVTLVNNERSDVQRRPRLDQALNGDFVISWGSNNQDGSSEGVFAKRYDANGTAIEEEFNEVQRLTLDGPPNAGSTFRLRAGGTGTPATGVIPYFGPNSGSRTAAAIQTALQALPGYADVTVSTTPAFGASDEIQEIFFNGPLPLAGTFRLAHRGLITEPIVFAGDTAANAATTATNIQTELRALANTAADQITVTAGVANDEPYHYIITFLGPIDGGINHPPLVPVDNQLNQGSLFVVTTDDGGTLQNQFTINYGGSAGRQDQPELELVGNTGGVTSITVDELVKGVDSEFPVNVETANEQRPGDTTVRADGSFLVTWISVDQDGDQGGIYGKLYDANGDVLREEFQINTFTQGNQQRPRAGTDAAGNFVVIWNSVDGQDGDLSGVYARRLGADGFPLGDEFLVNTLTAGNQSAGGIAVNPDGTFVTAFRSDAGAGGIHSQRFAADATQLGGEEQVSEYGLRNQSSPQIARADNGNYVIVWTDVARDDADNSDGIYGQLYDVTGSPIGSEFQVNTTEASAQSFPAVDMDAAGNFVVVWSSEELDANDNTVLSVFGQRFDAVGNPVGGEITIASAAQTEDEFLQPDVDINLTNGDFVVTWSTGISFGPAEVRGRVFNSAGIPQTDELSLANYESIFLTTPRVAFDSNGRFLVTYTSTDDGAATSELEARLFDSTGVSLSANLLAGVLPTDNFAFEMDVAVDSSGTFSVVWNNFDQNGVINISHVRIDASGNTGLPQTVSSQPLDDFFVPRISVAADGSTVVVWENELNANGIVVQRLDVNGTLVGPNITVGQTTGLQSSPAVTAGDGNDFTVAWLDDQNGLGVFQQSFTSDLASVGIKDLGPQGVGENVLQIWVDGSRTLLVGDNASTRIIRVQETAGRLFGVDSASNELLELDSLTGATIATYPLPATAGADAGLAFAAGTVYFVAGAGTELYQLDPNTGGTVTSTPLAGMSATGLAYLSGEIVLLDSTAGELVFVDPYRHVELRRLAPAVTVAGGLVGGGERGTLFAVDGTGQIVELSAADGSLLNTITAPGGTLIGLALVDGVLLASNTAGTVHQIDPDTGVVSGTLAVPAGVAALGADGDGRFATALGGNYQPFVGTILDDEGPLAIQEGVGPYSGRFVPVEPLSTFDDTNVRGSWRLEVRDTATGNVGVLHSWRLLVNEQQDTAPDVSQFGFIGDATNALAAPQDDVDIYRFDLIVGGTIQVDVTPAAGLDAVIRLFDSLGNELTSVDAAGTGGAEQLIHIAANSGVFFVGISSKGNAAYNAVDGSGAGGGTSSGSYGLDIRFDEPVVIDDDNSSFATAINIGTVGTGRQSIRTEIRSEPYAVQLPGSNSEPGHRDIPPETHLNASGGHQHSLDQVIIKFQDDVTESDKAAVLSEHGLTQSKSLDLIDAIVVDLSVGDDVVEKVYQLNGLAQVRYAEPNYIGTWDVVPNDAQFGDMWQLDNLGQTGGTVDADIDAPEAWDIFTGSAQTVIAIIDSGTDYNHPDLQANMWRNPGEIAGDGIDNDGNGYIDDIFGIDAAEGTSDPIDEFGHGTHVSGTTAAVGDNGIGVTGINWNAKIMSLAIGDAGPELAAAIEAVNYMTTMKTMFGINVVVSNNSYSLPFSQAFQDAIQASNDAGILFVAASGNSGVDIDAFPTYPASYPLPGIITVAATDHNDQLAVFSNFGVNSVDIAAPGVNTLSTTLGGGYGLNSGTSMASPHVAGAVALLAGYNGNATIDQIKSALLLGGDQLSNLTGSSVSGTRLNLSQALTLLDSGITGPSGSAILTAFYNFQDIYGTLPSGAEAVNAITENQKTRAREVFEFYGDLTGIEFIETDNEGLTVVTGDLRVLSPAVPTGPGGVAGISNGSLSGMVIMDAAENWGDSEYGGAWFETAMHEIGHSMGLGHTYDLPNLTVMGGFGTGEPVFPGDHDIVHATHLHKPASIDIDLYAFELDEDGVLTAETIAERFAPNASLLDTSISIYRDLGNGRRELMASNDDYFSNDSFVKLHLQRGAYFVGVNASNNSEMDPSISETGFGGTSQGDYKLVLDFTPDRAAGIVDTDNVPLDGDADGTPGGNFSFFFESGPTIFVDKMADTTAGVDGDGSLAAPLDNIFECYRTSAFHPGHATRWGSQPEGR